jgi:phosphoribosylformimino-5-aminoimidazole carboxamide ribonucleotide (ProFAR) isomerase
MPDIECVLDVRETIDLARSLGMNRIMYADTSWEGTLQGPDLACLKEIAEYSSMRITVGGGIGESGTIMGITGIEVYWH